MIRAGGTKMTHWDYRVLRKHCPGSDAISYQIHEVYYTDDSGIEHSRQITGINLVG